MKTELNNVGNIIDLASVRFPVGSKAWHHIFHVCYIVESRGNQRKIKSLRLGSDASIWDYAVVHVNELQKMQNPL